MDDKNIVNGIVAGAGVIFTWLFGEWDLMFKVLASFMVIDYVTGITVAFIDGTVDSRVGFKGILKKALMLILLIVSVLLDRLLGTEWLFRTATCYFLIGNEGLSILENVAKTGLPLPEKLRHGLIQLKEEGGNLDE